MESTEGALVVHDAMFVGPDGQELGPWTCPFSDGTILPDRFTERLLVQNFIAIPSPVFRRSVAIVPEVWTSHFGIRPIGIFGFAWERWVRYASSQKS